MIRYRRFQNVDPPALLEVWNDSLFSRGSYPIRHTSTIESFILSKPYFDPDGLIVARDDDEPAGFALSGFGPDEDLYGVGNTVGVICLLMVRPCYRRHGVGAELLRLSEVYLRDLGATTILAGPLPPNNPFGFGLYGGSNTPGFLNSDAAAPAFLESRGYQGERTTLVMQRSLEHPVNVVDPRFTALRRRYQVERVLESEIGSWWQECVLGPIEPVEFRLQERHTRRPVARALTWEMEGFSWRWGRPTVGLLGVDVIPELRGSGLGKLLVLLVIRFLQEQFFGLVEAQVPEQNQAGVGLLRSAGFHQVDAGRTYRKLT